MRFFEGVRPEVYVHSAKLRRDKKTGRRLWGFTLIVTFTAPLAETCIVPIAKAWQYITEQDSAAVDVSLSTIAGNASIEFFAHIDDADNVLLLDGVDLGAMRMTRDGTVVQFWFSGEHENTSRLHAFMKEYAYTRVWARFECAQRDLEMSSSDAQKVAEDSGVRDALAQMVAPVAEGSITSMSLQVAGEEPVVINMAAAKKIRAAARRKSD